MDEPDADGAFRRHADAVRRYCYRRVRDRCVAEDLAQEVFLRLHRARPVCPTPGHELAWLYTVAANICHDWHRANLRRPQAPLMFIDELDSTGHLTVAGPEEVVEEALAPLGLWDTVGPALATLTPMTRRCLELRAEEMSYGEIADALGMKVSAVKSAIHRARVRVRLEPALLD